MSHSVHLNAPPPDAGLSLRAARHTTGRPLSPATPPKVSAQTENRVPVLGSCKREARGVTSPAQLATWIATMNPACRRIMGSLLIGTATPSRRRAFRWPHVRLLRGLAQFTSSHCIASLFSFGDHHVRTVAICFELGDRNSTSLFENHIVPPTKRSRIANLRNGKMKSLIDDAEETGSTDETSQAHLSITSCRGYRGQNWAL